MYIINDTYFNSPKREVANLNEPDSKSFAELESLIDEKCRLLLLDFLTIEQVQDLETYLVNGLLPENAQSTNPLDPDYVPNMWLELIKGVNYEVNDVNLKWNGLAYSKGTYKGSLLADYVYSFWLESQVSYMTGVGDAKGNPKGANLVNPTQRYVNTWNDFVKAYQGVYAYNGYYDWWNYGFYGYLNLFPFCYRQGQEVSLMQFLEDRNDIYPNDNRKFFEIKNQLGF
jgi:hypothetical protein